MKSFSVRFYLFSLLIFVKTNITMGQTPLLNLSFHFGQIFEMWLSEKKLAFWRLLPRSKEDIKPLWSFKLPKPCSTEYVLNRASDPFNFSFHFKVVKNLTCALFSPREVCKIIDISDKITLKWQQTVTRREQTIYPRELSKVSEFSRTLYFKTNWWDFFNFNPFQLSVGSAAWKKNCSLLIKRIIKAYRRILLPLDRNCFLNFKKY